MTDNRLQRCVPALFLPVISAGLLFLAFPPADLWPLAWVALIPLLYSLDAAPSKRAAFGRAYLCGFIFFLVALQWVHHVTTLGLIFLAAYLALYYGAFGIYYRWIARFPAGVRPWMAPAGWAVLEWVRGWALTGFGWGCLGHTQADVLLRVIASVTGVTGVSFVVFGVNAALMRFYQAWRTGQNVWPVVRWTLALAGGVLAIALLMPFYIIGKVPETKIALIQPNISLAETRSLYSRVDIVLRLLELSRSAIAQKPDLIIWPETSFPQFVWELPDLFDEVKAFARDHKVSLLIGAVTRDKGEHYYNSALLISPEGEFVQAHSKRHLVLFGEYIPFRKQLPFLAALAPIDDFTAGTEDTIFRLPNGVTFSVLICFEDTVPGLSRRDAWNGADFLVNMTNDAWFGDSGQPRMHLNNARFRAIENGRELVRATNTGESCAVSRNGRMTGCVEQGGRRVMVDGVATVTVKPWRGRTFYTKYGDIFTFVCLIGILVLVLVHRRR